MKGKTFGSAPDLWTLGLWCEERPWTWSAGVQPSRVIVTCADGTTAARLLETQGLWPSGRCPLCLEAQANHRVAIAPIAYGTASPLMLLEETLVPPPGPQRWRDLAARWFPGSGPSLDAGDAARKAAVAIAAILTQEARATAARPIVQRMLVMDRASLSPAVIRSMVRPLGLVSDRTERIIGALDAYGTMHTPSVEPGPRGIGEVIGPYAEAAVRAIVLGQVVETDDPYLSRYVEWLKERNRT